MNKAKAVVVPSEPTEEMVFAMHGVVASHGGYRNGLLEDIYKAALYAAPSAQEGDAGRDAERYRRLRDEPATIIFDREMHFVTPNGGTEVHVKMIGNTELDAAIDAAIAASQNEGGKG